MDERTGARFASIYRRPIVLTIENLSKSFGGGSGDRVVLQDINLTIHRREFICVVGPSGCGKSTLARLLAGLDRPDRGRMLLDDREIDGPGPDRGMVFQSYCLFPWLTVVKNVMFGLGLQGHGSTDAEREALQWLSIVGLEEFAHHYPGQLSGGMKQRVAIARALAVRPRVLLMDEPFGALDAQTRGRMQHYLLEIWKNIDVSVVFITHDLDEAVYLADRIVVLKSNPGEVIRIVENPVPRPRDREQAGSAVFVEAKADLERLIHRNESEHPIHITKMTVEGDEVL
ncbi:MAG: ABC transporter ATP-binding protein [Spirochaetales bacterium]|nr:ABC transporter ATP-binding protein [Spirochaetales bacterium]